MRAGTAGLLGLSPSAEQGETGEDKSEFESITGVRTGKERQYPPKPPCWRPSPGCDSAAGLGLLCPEPGKIPQNQEHPPRTSREERAAAEPRALRARQE